MFRSYFRSKAPSPYPRIQRGAHVRFRDDRGTVHEGRVVRAVGRCVVVKLDSRRGVITVPKEHIYGA